jgi:hypothetical protein
MDELTHELANGRVKLKSANIRGVNSSINRYEKPGHIVRDTIRGLKD